jgi:hypothetical protein
MFVLELDLAVYKRLTGAPLDSRGLPELDPITHVPVNTSRVIPPGQGGGEGPSYGIRIPVMKHPFEASRGLTTNNPGATPLFRGFSQDTHRQIPVFDENIEGRKWTDVWPCVTFRWNATEADSSVYIYYDDIVAPDPLAEPVSIHNRNGDVVGTGVSSELRRPHPDSYKAQYVITARAKSHTELSLICAQILHLFPMKGAIVVEYANGDTHPCDMFLENSIALDGQSVMGQKGYGGGDNVSMVLAEEQRGYARAFVYQIEAYVDNTTNYYGTQDVVSRGNLIYSHLLEIENLQETLIQRVELSASDLDVW